MKISQSKFVSVCLLAMALVFAGCSSAPNDPAATDASGSGGSGGSALGKLLGSSTQPIDVPEGTAIAVTLDQAINTDVNRTGESFEATVSEPVVVNGKTVIPKGATVAGTIVEAKESGRLKGVAVLRLALDVVEVDGKEYEIKTSAVSLRGDSHTKRNTAMIGGGAGAGAVIGAIAGGGKGAAIGAAVGAGAGTAGAAATGKKDVKLAPETPLTFKLSQPVTIQVKK